MLVPKTKGELAKDAFTLSHGHRLVRHRHVTYIPADFETLEVSVQPDIDRTIWLPLPRENLRRLAAAMFSTLFANDSELTNFDFMVSQTAIQLDKPVDSLLLRTPDGLRELDDQGRLIVTDGEFRPNTLLPMLNTEQEDKDFVFDVIEGWLNSEEEARSLLHHLATSLAPGWSTVKYVLLLGGGRNGKSTLLKMLVALFGRENCSNVTRQSIAQQSPVVTELNGKLVNVVFDGPAEYLKDSGAEKTLIAGETYPIRELYRSVATPVQTNALFIEGLQTEPKTKDKSTALQKRLVRYQFPNVYPQDNRFEKRMLSEKYLGAFLALLIDHYVKEDELASKLAPTKKAIELAIEHQYANSLGMQFLKFYEEDNVIGVDDLIGRPMSDLAQFFKSWRVQEMDTGNWTEPDVQTLFTPLLNSERKSDRQGAKVVKVRVITGLKEEALAFINSMKGDDGDADHPDSVVED